MAKAGVPKRDGSGRGVGANRGRGCAKPTWRNRVAVRGERGLGRGLNRRGGK